MKNNIKFKFRIGRYNGTMSMTITVNGINCYTAEQFDSDNIVVETLMLWPGIVDIVVTNKGPRDTRIDNDGNILEDKFIELEQIIIDNMPIPDSVLRNMTQLFTVNGQKLSTTYWGFNGSIRLSFESNNSFNWFLTELAKNSNKSSIYIASSTETLAETLLELDNLKNK